MSKKYTTDGLEFKDGQRITWNDTDKTINIPTGLGPTLQVGQETIVHVYNATTETLINGRVVYPVGTTTNQLLNVEYAIANQHETIERQIGMLTSDILPGSDGFVTLIGTVRDIDTSHLSLGRCYISADTPGGLTSTRPVFPNYDTLMGIVLESSVTGKVVVDIRNNINDTFTNFFNGTFRESFNFDISSSGGIVTGSLYPSNGHPNLTMIFDDGLTTLITTPPATIELTAGTDTVPQMNYVYIPSTTKVLTVSTTGFPIEEHIAVAEVYLQSADATESDNALKLHLWSDEVQSTITKQGHLSHITDRLRQESVKWKSGGEVICTTTPTTVDIETTEAVVYQLHRHTFPAFNTATGSHVHIVNDSVSPFKEISDLETLILDANGDPLENLSFSFVVWGAINEAQGKMFINLPLGGYSKNFPTEAVSDANNYSVYGIPSEFSGSGFLIARLNMILSNGSWSLHSTESLLGRETSLIGGGSAGGLGGGVTAFNQLTDTPSSYVGQGNKLAKVGSSEMGIEYSNITDDVIARTDVDSDFDTSQTINGSLLLSDSGVVGLNIKNTGATFNNNLSVGGGGNPSYLSNWLDGAKDNTSLSSFGITLGTTLDNIRFIGSPIGQGTFNDLLTIDGDGSLTAGDFNWDTSINKLTIDNVDNEGLLIKGNGTGVLGRTSFTVENTSPDSASSFTLKNGDGGSINVQCSAAGYTIGESANIGSAGDLDLILSTDNNLPTDGTADVLFRTGGYNTTPFVAFTHDNKVGINTLSPDEALHVVGNIKVSGTVDGIDIGTDVAANTSKISFDSSSSSRLANTSGLNTGDQDLSGYIENKGTGTDSIGIGESSVSSQFGGIAIGSNSSTTVWQNGIAIGTGSTSTQEETVTVGINSLTSGFNSISIGSNSNAVNESSIAMGYYAKADTNFSISIGAFSDSVGWGSTALGADSQAMDSGAVAIGQGAEANADSSVSIGSYSYNYVSNLGGTAIGSCSTVGSGHDNSVALGYWSTTTKANQIMLGRSTTEEVYTDGNVVAESFECNVSNEISGADAVLKVVSCTQAEYNAGTRTATTLYIING